MSTLLEFNRDLFLCNNIHDPQNQSDIIPSYNNGKIYKRSNITDPYDNIYVLGANYLDTTQYKSGIYKDGDIIITAKKDTIAGMADYNTGYAWAEDPNVTPTNPSLFKVSYDNYIQKLDNYLNGKNDVWVGSGKVVLEIIPPPTPAPTTTSPTIITTSNSINITTTPAPTQSAKEKMDEMIVGGLPPFLNIMNKVVDFEANQYNPNSVKDIDVEFEDVQNKILALKDTIHNYSLKKSPPETKVNNNSDTVPTTTPQSLTPTYIFRVKGGSLVRVNQGLVGDCDKYKLTSVCPINPDDPQEQENCEICKNFNYRDWYDNNQKTHINRNARYEDSTKEYVYTWLQTWNLGIGIGIIVYGIYYQLS